MKRKNKRTLFVPLLAFILIISQSAAIAQIMTPIKWSYAAKRVSANEADVLLKASIAPGWHVYSTKQPPGGPLKTSFKFKKSPQIILVNAVAEPQPQKKFEKAFDMDVFYFENEVIFSQTLRFKGKATSVKGSVEYMACNDEKCLPPETINFNILIK